MKAANRIAPSKNPVFGFRRALTSNGFWGSRIMSLIAFLRPMSCRCAKDSLTQASTSQGATGGGISKHQRGVNRPLGTSKECQSKHRRLRVHRRQLDRNNSSRFPARLDSRGENFALCHLDRRLTTALQTCRNVWAQLRVGKRVERLAVPRRIECHHLWCPGHVGFWRLVPNRVADEDLPIVLE